MELAFEPMTEAWAAEIASWRYPEPYGRYGFGGEDQSEVVRDLINPKNHFLAVLDSGNLIAFRSFGKDGQVRGGDYVDGYLDTGGGLRPDMTGQGLGAELVRAGLVFGWQNFGTSRFRVTIADFNQRALRVCENVGFQSVQKFRRDPDGEPFTVLTIDLNA